MTNEDGRVTVWTVHPAKFDISRPDLEYDHTRGQYWQIALGEPRVREYRKLIPVLCRHFQAGAILWCSSSLIGWWSFPHRDEVVWELDLPTSSILAHFDELLWPEVIAGKIPLDLSQLCLPRCYPITKKCEVLVGWPLPPESRIIRLGPFLSPGQVTEYHMERLRAGKV